MRCAGAAIVIGVVASIAVAAPAAAKAPAKKLTPKPDLKISLFKPHLGNPAYAVVGTDGRVEPIEVEVTTYNQGKVKAPASITVVELEDSAHHDFMKEIRVGALKPHQHFHRIVSFTGVKLALGFAQLRAEADFIEKIKESDKSNNVREERVAIVAKQWNVSVFQTQVTPRGTGSDLTYSAPGFRFVLARFDHSRDVWHYDAIGSVTNAQSLSGVCFYNVSDKKSRNPWGGDSGLEIAADLGGYEGIVQSSLLPKYAVSGTCLGGFPYHAMVGYNDLLTFVGEGIQEAAMSPSDTDLSRTVEGALNTTFTWDFKAAIGGTH